jgi:hypothetical protein
MTRFSGCRSPPLPGSVHGLPDAVAREPLLMRSAAPGSGPAPRPFRSTPTPILNREGFRDRAVKPGSAFDTTLGEFILPHDTLARARNPEALLLDFLSTTFGAAAEIAGWGRAALECPFEVPRRIRPI